MPEGRKLQERRRWPRYPVSWRVYVRINDAGAVMAHAVDASLHGLRVQLEYTVASRVLRRGQRYRIEVELPATGGGFVRTGAVRYISERAVGFEILEPLPAFVLDEPSARHEPRRRRSKMRSDSMPNPAPESQKI